MNSKLEFFDFAAWTQFIPESEIRRLLRYDVPYYFAGGKPGAIPVDVFAKILIELGSEQLEKIKRGPEGKQEVIDEYNYGPTAGLQSFRETLAKYLREKDGIPLSKEDGWKEVVITTGSQQAIYTILDTLIDPGDAILTPAPVYLGFVTPAEKLGAKVICVPTDLDGIIPEYVEEALQAAEKSDEIKKPPEILYVIADSDNPKGTTLPTKRRKQLFDIAETWNLLIIEDAAYREIQFKNEKLPAIKSFDKENQRVAYLRTTSKEAAPFRVGYSVMPDALREQVIKDKGYLDLCTPSLIQKILNIYYANYFEKTLSEITKIYEKRCKAMCNAIDETFPEGERTNPTGGFFVWWQSKKMFDAKRFLEKVALPNQILYVPGHSFYPIKGYVYNPDTKRIEKSSRNINTMRLGFSYRDERTIEIGVKKLGKLLTEELK